MTTVAADLRPLFEKHFQEPPERIEPLEQELGASPRKLFRLSARDRTAIGVFYDVRAENVAFIEFSKHFRRHGLPVPEIYGANLERNVYLEEDLGDTTLYQLLTANRHGGRPSRETMQAYREVVALLPRFQVEAGRDLDYGVCTPRSRFDRQSILWDLNYFKYCFLKLAGIPFDEQGLEEDFQRLALFLVDADAGYFLYRDFQARNVMMREDRPFFVDYQGGRRGALQYDIASLLYDAKADLPADVREELLESYLEALSRFIELDRTAFMRHYEGFVWIRIMQALGAYGFRGLYEGKGYFVESIPYAVRNIAGLLADTRLPIELPALMATFRSMVESEELKTLPALGNR